MFEQTFKNIDDVLYKDAGSDSELDYVGQTSWILFLKYLDELEKEKSIEASLSGKVYKPIIEDKFKWSNWAVLKDKDGNLDLNNQMDADILVDFVKNLPVKNLVNIKRYKFDLQSLSNKLRKKPC